MKHQTTKETREIIEGFCYFIAVFGICLLIASTLF